MNILMRAKNLVFLALTLMIIISSCSDRSYETGTIVHPDGSIDRKVICLEADSSQSDFNIFGVSQKNGWEMEHSLEFSHANEQDTILQDDGTTTVTPDTFYKNTFTFTKHFNSVDEVNLEMDEQNAKTDTLFRIRSTFQKRFRWFFTYLDYGDTYLPMIRFHHAPAEDYFAPEDYAFIRRLPVDIKLLSKADTRYLSRLNHYIQEDYYEKALLMEYFGIMVDAMQELNTDTAIVNKFLYVWNSIDSFQVEPQNFQHGNKAVNDSSIQKLLENEDMFDEERISIPEEVYSRYYQKSKDFDPQIRFMNAAYDVGYYKHSITMPWKVVCTNADSVSGSELFWKPYEIEFVFSDYTMSATSRKLNLWAWIVTAIASLGVIGLIIWRIRR